MRVDCLRRRGRLQFAGGSASSGGEREGEWRQCGEASFGVKGERERGAEAEDEAGEEDKVAEETASQEAQVEEEGQMATF